MCVAELLRYDRVPAFLIYRSKLKYHYTSV